MAISFEQAYPVLYRGWGRTEAEADFRATGGANKAGYQELVASSGGGAGVPQTSSAIETAKQLLQFQQQAAQPAISSLQASVPEVTQRFATEKARLGGEAVPLEQRYANLLSQITQRETADISGQELVTSREFGRRGIPTTSGLLEQTLQEKTSPLRQYYAGQVTEAGISKEEGLRNLQNLISQLTGQETEQQRAISNAIAQLQAGEPSTAVTQALSLLQGQQTQQASAAEQAWREKVYKETTLPESQYATGKPYYSPNTSTSSGNDWS